MRSFLPCIIAAMIVLASSGCVSENGFEPEPVTTTTIEEMSENCASLFWFDSEHKECGYRKFCGAYMYLGLRTFQTLEECENTIASEKAGNYIKITSAPSNVNVNSSFFISWYINTSPSKITHSSVRYGKEHMETPGLPSDYAQSSSILCSGTNCNVPGPFSVQISLSEPGTYYARAYALVNGINLWSEEKQIIASNPVVPVVRTYEIEADDYGFYINGSPAYSLEVNKNDIVNITFMARTSNVYTLGLDFRGCGQFSSALPGQESQISFDAKNNCAISSYWPSTGVLKSSITIIVVQ